MNSQKIPLEELVQDFDFYPRTMVSAPHVAALCDAIQAGHALPPIVADRKTKRISDGFHRYRAYKRLKTAEVEVELRNYKNDAELFADAVSMNSAHGRPLVPFERKRAVERLRRFGMSDVKIVELIHAPIERVLEIVSNFAMTPGGEERAVKAAHEPILSGESISKGQEAADKKRDGMNPTYHARQLIIALSSGLWQDTEAFRAAMEELFEAWGKAAKRKRTA